MGIKSAVAVAAVCLTLGVVDATAQPGGRGDPQRDTPTEQLVTPVEQSQGQAQLQGQAQGQEANANAGAIGTGTGIGVGGGAEQGQKQTSRNTNLNAAQGGEGGTGIAGAVAGSASGSISGSRSGAASNVGDTTSISEGSDSRSASGAIAGASSGGNDTAQDVSLDASDNSTQTITYDNDYPVSTAASLFTQTCQQGVSGQGKDLGASVVFSDPLCDTLKVAAAYWDYHILEHEHGNDKQAAYWKEKYVEQMKDVETLMEATDEVAIADRFAGYLIKPLGVIALIVFLL